MARRFPTDFDLINAVSSATLLLGSHDSVEVKVSVEKLVTHLNSVYATVAQGAKADTAVQPAALSSYATTSALNAAIAALSTVYQPLTSELTALAAISGQAYGRSLLTSTNFAALAAILGSGTPSGSTFLRGDGTWASPAGGGGGDLLAANNLSDVANAGTARTNLGLAIGTHVQAYDADLAAIATLSPSNDDLLQRKAGAWTNRTIAQLLTDLAAAGTTFQPLAANLTEWAGINPSANGGSLVSAADYAAMRTLLGYPSTANGLGASLIGIEDSGSYYAGTTVEAALAFLGARVADLDAAVILRGGWDASAGTFPGGGTAQAGDSYQVTVAGIVDGVAFSINDRVIAITDNASTTVYATNWLKADYSDLVASVAGKTGAVTLQVADITDMSANARTFNQAANFAAMLSALGGQPLDSDLTSIAALTTTSFGRSVLEAANAAALATLAGVGTGNSPQFAGIELGHATQNTLTASGGVLSIEGAALAFRDNAPTTLTGTTEVAALAHGGKIVEMNNGSANTYQIPLNATIAFPVGTIINVLQYGAGVTSIEAVSGVTLNGVADGIAAISARYAGVSLVKRGTNEWTMQGAHGTVA